MGKQIYDVLLASRIRIPWQENVEHNTFPVKLTNQKVYMKHTRATNKSNPFDAEPYNLETN